MTEIILKLAAAVLIWGAWMGISLAIGKIFQIDFGLSCIISGVAIIIAVLTKEYFD